MKFNLKHFSSKAGDNHTERRLQEEHSSASNFTTQKQLEDNRVEEKDVVIEKLLDQKRLGNNQKITEKNLDDSSSKLVVHRNPKASAGDINKVEEQRIAKSKKMETEKYKPSSRTPSKQRWWENLKAESKKKTITAQADATPYDLSPEIGDFSPEFESELVEEDFTLEEVGLDTLTLRKAEIIDNELVQGVYLAFDVDEENTLDLSQLQELAYSKIKDSKFKYLTRNPQFSALNFNLSRNGNILAARLIGPEFLPRGGNLISDEDEKMEDNIFSLEEIGETEVEGVVLGKVNISPEMIDIVANDMSNEEIKEQVRNIVFESRDDINIEDDGFDFSELRNGSISFVGQTGVSTVESSNDFDIVVLSQNNITKKNWTRIK